MMIQRKLYQVEIEEINLHLIRTSPFSAENLVSSKSMIIVVQCSEIDLAILFWTWIRICPPSIGEKS